MTAETALILLMIAAVGVFYAWAFRHLPGERWQVLAAVPVERLTDGGWRGVNLTYYGFFNALAVVSGVSVALVLDGAAGVPVGLAAAGVVIVLLICIPAARIVNRIVEGHWHGFTIGGASFVGFIAAPPILLLVSRIMVGAPAQGMALALMGSLASAYALGEGIGRLACISFGCCYGKPVSECPLWIRNSLGRFSIVYKGAMKKAVYERGLNGEPLVPVQALTSLISTGAGIAGMAFFLRGYFDLAYIVPVVVTQLWRFLSEFIRADYRGGGRISAYQWMAVFAAIYTVVLVSVLPLEWNAVPDLMKGAAILWRPETILLIQLTGLLIFFRMGVSSVTTSKVEMSLTSGACRRSDD